MHADGLACCCCRRCDHGRHRRRRCLSWLWFLGLSIQLLAGWALTSSMGFMLSDVTTDAILVERSKHEPAATRGSMQAIGYSVRFVGR